MTFIRTILTVRGSKVVGIDTGSKLTTQSGTEANLVHSRALPGCSDPFHPPLKQFPLEVALYYRLYADVRNSDDLE